MADNKINFRDVQKHWGKPVIELAAAKGLIKGVGGDSFAPNRSVTRAEFAAMLVAALGQGTTAHDDAPPYDDVKPDSWYYGAVAKAEQIGLLDFASGASFRANQTLTREEMASMLAAAVFWNNLPSK